MSLDAHVVTHTHWDREWYLPFARFQQRLVSLIDELIDDPPRADESFLLDGQAIILGDYLDIRPDRAEALAALLRGGRLEAGPWYVLADELIPSGEALVRNLLAGRRGLRRFGATAPPVLYCPDSFGHPGILPSLAAGFGLPLIIAWRGYGSTHWPAGDTVRWRAPNGDEALLFHLSRDGYELGSNLPADAEVAAARWTLMRDELAARSVTGVLLVPNGADHHARQSHWREAIAALEDAGRDDGRDDGARRSSLAAFANAVVARAAAIPLPTVSGELRESYGFTWTLQGTFATRAHEKRLNAHAERLLLREAEPWSALASLRGVSARPLVEAAWRTVLSAHPHDTLCGCSIDAVAQGMELRLSTALTQAVGIRDDAIATLIGHDAVAARTARDRWQPMVVVRNAAPRRRSGVALIDVDEFLMDVRVGPGSASGAGDDAVITRRRPAIGKLGKLQALARSLEHSRTESPRHYPDDDLVVRTRVAAWVDDAPPYGIACYQIGTSRAAAPGPSEPVLVEARAMRNAHLAVAVDARGAVSLEERATGRVIANLLELIDEDDAGDLYTPAPRARAYTVDVRDVRRVHRGPLRGELLVRARILDASVARRTDVELDARLILDADSRVLRIHVRGVNRRRDHRLRLAIHADVDSRPDSSVWADAAFGPVHRTRIDVSPSDAAAELPPPTAPLHRYASRFDDSRGVTVFSDGLAEYEARDDGSLAVTLVRAVGELSRNDLPERPGHAGWPSPTPGAQCLGPFEAELGVLLHGPREPATVHAIEHAADDFLLPLVGTTLRSALSRPDPVVGFELVGNGLACSAIKESETGGAIVLRCVNILDQPVRGAWRLPFDPASAALARLDETPMSELECRGREVTFDAAPRDIVTLVVR